jgi:hypothetical protein
LSLVGSIGGTVSAALGAGTTPPFVYRPRAVVTLAGNQLTSAQAGLVRVQVRLSLSGAHDAAHVMMWPASRLANAHPGDALAIGLGDDGSELDVWAGQVSAVQSRADGAVLEGLAATASLSTRRKSQCYLAQSVADIVNDLAAGAAIDTVEGALQLEAYAVDERRSVWAHIVDLAALAGADLGASAAGGLRFVQPKSGSASLALRYGGELVAFRASAAPTPDSSPIAPYGAASEAGSDKWHWLLNTPSASGSGAGPQRVLAALRTRDAASTVAQALAKRAGRASVRGHLLVLGLPDVRPGDLVETQGVPSGDLGTLRVLAVDHILHARGGFTTALTVEKASS